MSVKRSWVIAVVVLVALLFIAPVRIGGFAAQVRDSTGTFLQALGFDE